MKDIPHAVAETSHYMARAKKRMTEEERDRALLMIASDPTCGDLVQGTGGIRKVRFATGQGGKRGGVRIIYFFYDERMPIYLLTVFAKNEKSDLTAEERKILSGLVLQLVQTHRGSHGR